MKTSKWFSNYKILRNESRNFLPIEYKDKLFKIYREAQYSDELAEDFNSALIIAHIAINELGLNKAALCTVMLYPLIKHNRYELESIKTDFSEEIFVMVNGLTRVKNLYGKTSTMETENFRKLLLTFAEDVRVIFIMLSERLYYTLSRHFTQALTTLFPGSRKVKIICDIASTPLSSENAVGTGDDLL